MASKAIANGWPIVPPGASRYGASTSVLPGPEPSTYLPTVSAAPVIAVGVRRLISGYSGGLIQARKADGTTADIGGDGVADYAALDAFTTSPTIQTLYDQSGNGFHLTQATAANQPIMDNIRKRGSHRAVVFDGLAATHKDMAVTGLTLDNRALSVFYVFQPKTGRAADYHFEASSATPAPLTAMATRGNSSARSQRSNYQVLGFTNSAAAYTHYMDGKTFTQGAKVAGTVTSILVGKQSTAAVSLTHMNLLAIVAYPAALSTTDANAVVDALNTMFGLETYQSYTDQVVLVGDSILAGLASNQNIGNFDVVTSALPLLSRPIAIWNMGNPSQLLTGGVGLDTNKAAYEFAIVDTAQFTGKRVLTIQIGTNDLGTNGATAGYGATLYSAMTSYIASARAAGFTHIILCTLLPRADTNWTPQTTQRWIEMQSYNSLVLANSAGADAILDLTAVAGMGTFTDANNAAAYQDKLHPTAAGHQLLAPAYAAAINAVLAA